MTAQESDRCVHCASSGKISSPPAASISSETQRIAEIWGVSHSSKYTRGYGVRARARACSRFTRHSSIRTWADSLAPTIAPKVFIMSRIPLTERWLNTITLTPARISSWAMSACRSEKPRTRSGDNARIRSMRALVKALTRGFSFRACGGLTVKPEIPTIRSASPIR